MPESTHTISIRPGRRLAQNDGRRACVVSALLLPMEAPSRATNSSSSADD
eukprot:SAG11_NODE_10263_length_843_cov_1.231183_1_plen_49_part_10